MHYVHTNRGTCSSQVSFDIENGILHNVKYIGGCNGNLKAISKLVNNMRAEEIARLLLGNTCGFKKTSCADQLAKAVLEAKEEEAKRK